jgi:hypothetical protein
VAIAPHDPLITTLSRPGWRDFIELAKPRLSLLIGVGPDVPFRTLHVSITYLMALSGAFIADHYCGLLV